MAKSRTKSKRPKKPRFTEVVGVVFDKNNNDTNFSYMIKNKNYQNCLFIFNDNFTEHFSCKEGSGNAVIRPYNMYGSYKSKPRSAGIPTGLYRSPGYLEFNKASQKQIHQCLHEILELMRKHKYTKIFYSRSDKDFETPDGKKQPIVGVSIFKPSDFVLQYITYCIYKLQSIDMNTIPPYNCIDPWFSNYFPEGKWHENGTWSKD